MRRTFLSVIALLLTAAGCVVGPDYKRPTAPVPTAYTEPRPAGDRTEWKTVQPMDSAQRGKWWEVFEDPELDALEEQVSVSNQNIAQAEAEWRGAQAAVRGTRAQYYPSVGLAPAVTRGSAPAGDAGASPDGSHPTITTYELPVSFAWEIDLFGGIRRSVESSVANAQASAADLESARLSMHAQLATDYFLLRGLDEEKRLLDSSVAAYSRTLELTTNRYKQGVVSGVDVAQAQTQLEATMAQSTDVSISRAQTEDAIAILVGRPPGDFSLPPAESAPAPPAIPPQVPSNRSSAGPISRPQSVARRRPTRRSASRRPPTIRR